MEKTHFDIQIRPPAGVRFIQGRDGVIRARVSVKLADTLRITLTAACQELARIKMRVLESERDKEIQRRKIPPSRLEQIESELKRRREELIDAEAEKIRREEIDYRSRLEHEYARKNALQGEVDDGWDDSPPSSDTMPPPGRENVPVVSVQRETLNGNEIPLGELIIAETVR